MSLYCSSVSIPLLYIALRHSTGGGKVSEASWLSCDRVAGTLERSSLLASALACQTEREKERERGKVKVNAVTPVKDIKFKVLLNIVKLKVQWTLVEHTWSALLCMSASFWLVFWLSKNWWLRGQLQTREEILSQCAAGDEWQSPYTRNEDNEGNISCSCLT